MFGIVLVIEFGVDIIFNDTAEWIRKSKRKSGRLKGS